MIKSNKKAIAFASVAFCGLFAFLSFGSLPNIAANAIDNEYDIVSEKECEIAANKWLVQNYDDDTVIDEIIPVMTGEKITSYCVNFTCNGEPNGYIIIDSDKESRNFIPEFSLSGKGIYETLSESAEISNTFATSKKVIYSVGNLDYAIPINREGSVLYSSSNETITKSALKHMDEQIAAKKPSFVNERTEAEKKIYYDGFFSETDMSFNSLKKLCNIDGANSFKPSLMSELRVEGGFSGNCTPTAATNLFSLHVEERWGMGEFFTRQEIYNSIVSFGKWNQFGELGMTLSSAIKGMKSTARSIFFHSLVSISLSSDGWDKWEESIVENIPILTAVWGLKNNNGSWEEVGHAIVGIGYRVYDDGACYLRVLDGWYPSNERYIWFNSDYFTDKEGYSIIIL
ncbi:MAG: C39 family peptidase [Clostridia bacterium]|nr:C39 family peptidase [Clostridia bacterium]